MVVPRWNAIINSHRKNADRNRKLLQEFYKSHPGILAHSFNEGHYGTLKIPRSFRAASEFAKVLERKSVRVCPCEPFGDQRSIRISTYVDPKKFAHGFKIISQFY